MSDLRQNRRFTQAHEISAFLVWGGAIVYGCEVIVFGQQEGNLGLVAAGPVGESVAVLDKLLCKEGFHTGCGGGGFFA